MYIHSELKPLKSPVISLGNIVCHFSSETVMRIKQWKSALLQLVFGLSYSGKKPNRGAEDMEFPGVLKKEYAEIPGIN